MTPLLFGFMVVINTYDSHLVSGSTPRVTQWLIMEWNGSKHCVFWSSVCDILKVQGMWKLVKKHAKYVAGVWICCWQQIQIHEYCASQYNAYFTPVNKRQLWMRFWKISNQFKRLYFHLIQIKNLCPAFVVFTVIIA